MACVCRDMRGGAQARRKRAGGDEVALLVAGEARAAAVSALELLVLLHTHARRWLMSAGGQAANMAWLQVQYGQE